MMQGCNSRLAIEPLAQRALMAIAVALMLVAVSPSAWANDQVVDGVADAVVGSASDNQAATGGEEGEEPSNDVDGAAGSDNDGQSVDGDVEDNGGGTSDAGEGNAPGNEPVAGEEGASGEESGVDGETGGAGTDVPENTGDTTASEVPETPETNSPESASESETPAAGGETAEDASSTPADAEAATPAASEKPAANVDEPAAAPSATTGKSATSKPAVRAEDSQAKPAAQVKAKAAPKMTTQAPTAVVAKPVVPASSVTAKAKRVASAAKRVLDNGTYLFLWVHNKGYYATSKGDSVKSGANAVLNKTETKFRQRWKVKFHPKSGFYTIVNEYTRKALTVASAEKGANVYQQKADPTDESQLWSIVKTGKTYVFTPAGNKKLALTAHKEKGVYNLSLRKMNKNTVQRFAMRHAGVVRNGLYSVGVKSDSKKIVEVPGYSLQEKTRLQLNTYEGGLTQKFKVKHVGDDLYTLQSLHSGKYMGVSGDSVVQKGDSNALAQRWKIGWSKKGLTLRNASNGKRLTMASSMTAKTLMSTVKASNAKTQRFDLHERLAMDEGTYVLHSFAGGRVLGIEDSSFEEMGNVDAEKPTTENNQKFRIEYVKNGLYRIVNVNSGMLVGYSSTSAGANVRQRENHNSMKQLWKVRVSSNGGIQFVGANGGKVMNIVGVDYKDGANVNMAKSANSKQQRWWLEKTKAKPQPDPVVNRALKKAKYRGSSTNYYIAVDVKNHRTIVMKNMGGAWKVEKNWICSVGAPSTPTVLGNYEVGIKGYSFGSGYTCYYYTQFYGDYLFHSVKYYEGTFKVKDGRLGQDVSEGCVRLQIDNAKWIYNNIPEGTHVETYK